MAETNTVYTPRFGKKSSLTIGRKRAPKEMKVKDSSVALAGPRTHHNQIVGTEIKAKRLKMAKLVSVARKEEHPPKVCIPLCERGQTSLKCTKTSKKKKEIIPEESTHHLTQSRTTGVVNESVFSFSYTDGLTPSKTSAVKQRVLRTISKMLEENRVIRRRLIACNQESRAAEHTEL